MNLLNRVALTLVVVSLVAGGCGGGNGSPTNPTPPNNPIPQPPAQTFSLSGTITESAPTSTIGIGGAVLTIQGGPQNGHTTAADSTGNFTFSGLSSGTFTLRGGAAGYDPNTRSVTLSANQTGITLQLTPTFQMITSTRSDSISGGDTPCVTSTPCKAFSLDIHHSGLVTSRLSWTDGDTWLWLGIYRADGTRLVEASQSRVDGLFQEVSTNVQGGQRYLLVIRYVLGARVTNFNLTATRPN